MRISISGSHCTGKTTLARYLSKELIKKFPNKVIHIDEVARKVISLGFPLNMDATYESYFHYIWFQLEQERKAKSVFVISDRSLVDLLAYIRANNNPQISRSFVCLLQELLWLETKSFDFYIYLPIEFQLEVDDVRLEDVDYQKLVDEKIVDILVEYGVKYYKVRVSTHRSLVNLINLIIIILIKI